MGGSGMRRSTRELLIVMTAALSAICFMTF
jgi:hypothetical protein